VFLDKAGNLYGATGFGGTSNDGIVYKLTLTKPLNDFTANVVASRFLHSTAVTGQFLPTDSIDLSTQAVSLSVAGTNTSDWMFPAGSFRNVAGSYIANATSGSKRIIVELSPLTKGNWTYAAVIVDYVPGSAPVTVNLTIGIQHGTATVNARQVF
jgi:uncharacterized repeat protein (TIGR03803 family)